MIEYFDISRRTFVASLPASFLSWLTISSLSRLANQMARTKATDSVFADDFFQSLQFVQAEYFEPVLSVQIQYECNVRNLIWPKDKPIKW